MATKQKFILWTGGWDSTYRMVEICENGYPGGYNLFMYQEITGVTATIEDLRQILSGEAAGKNELQYMHRLK